MTDQKIISVSSIVELVKYNLTDICVAVGVFDGVHSGHRKLLQTLTEMALRLNAEPVVLTFFPHPREVLFPGNAPHLILAPERRIKLLHEYGARAVVTLPFTLELASTSPREFIEKCLFADGINLRGVCVGKDWHFGAGGRGDTKFMSELAKEKHFEFVAVDELLETDGRVVSSSLVRSALSEGFIRQANSLLGRHYTLCGKVEKGYHIATDTLACPTANLNVEYGIVPPIGVYASIAVIDGKRFPAVTNIGTAPTFDSHGIPGKVRIEVHLLGVKYDLYDKEMELELVRKIRDEKRFESTDALRQQIEDDIQKAAEYLEKEQLNDN